MKFAVLADMNAGFAPRQNLIHAIRSVEDTMRLIVIALAIALTGSAAAKEPVTEAVQHAGDICKATGGFGRVFSRGYGHVDATAGDDWAPFGKLTIAAGEITSEASFRGAGDSAEDDAARAEKFFKALDKAVTAKKRFAHRETNGNAVRFSSGKEPGSGVVLELRQDGDAIVATCSAG